MATETVKRDRVGVLASTIINELSRDRIEALRRQKEPPPEPPFVPTPAMKALHVAWKRHRAAQKDLENRARKAGCVLGHESISRPWRSHEGQRAALKASIDKRIADVRELRTATLIDVVGMDTEQVKASIKKFRAAIERA